MNEPGTRRQAPHDPKRLRQETLQAAALYFAAGIDPGRSTVFVQSHVRAHTELTWLLNCVTPMNWLERMIQFKEKAVKQVGGWVCTCGWRNGCRCRCHCQPAYAAYAAYLPSFP